MSRNHDPDVPEWAKPGLDDPDSLDPPSFPSTPPSKGPRPSHVVGCRCLTCLLIRLRLALHSEAPSRLHQTAAPVLKDFDGVVDRKYPDEGGVGPPMTAAMHRYLSGPDSWGTERLAMLSIIEVSGRCAARHPPHRRPMFTRTICGQLVFEAAYLGQDLADLLWLHPELSADQLAGMLAWGLSHAEEWRADKLARWTKVPGAEEPLPERRRVVA